MKKRTRTKTPPQMSWDGQVWPLERDILFRPDRFKYVRKLIKPQGCVFCQAGSQKPSIETLCVYQSQRSMIVLNKYPYNTGHCLVLPRKHGGDVMDLKLKDYEDLMLTFRRAVQAVQKIYKPDGINMGMNHGAVSGAGIPGHLHFHIVPRWAGDLNFFPLIAETKVLIESLPETYDRFMRYFKKV